MKLIKQQVVESTNSSDTSDISELNEDEELSDSEDENVLHNQPRPSASDLSYGVPLPKAPLPRKQGSQNSVSSRTSFVRGFSPSPQPPKVNVEPPANSNSQTSQHSSTSSKSQNIFANNKNIFYIANSPSPPELASANKSFLGSNDHHASPKSKNNSTENLRLRHSNNASPRSKNNSSENLLRLRNSNNPSPRSRNNSSENLLRLRDSNNASPRSTNNSSVNLLALKNNHASPKSKTNSSEPLPHKNPPNTGVRRQGSLFSNYQIKAKRTDGPVVNANDDDDNSSTDISDGSFFSESEDEEVESIQGSNLAAKSLKLSDQSFIKSRRSTISKSEDNESEWMSVSSESDLNSPKVSMQPLKFDKKIPLAIPARSTFSNSTDTFQNATIYEENDEDLAESSSMKSKQMFRPTSLLSGLFLNDLAAKEGFNSASPKKPFLKRSSTTGIITIDQDLSATGRDRSKITRPSIMVSKKYTSLTDISKNYPNQHHTLLKNSHITPDISLKKPSPEVAGPPASDDDSEDDSLFAKQKSIVSISDFTVTTKPSSIHSGDTSVLDNGDRKSEPSTVTNEISLSSSLNKYSSSMNNHSLSKIISKSSMSLSNLFNQSKNRISSTSNNFKNRSYLHPHKIPNDQSMSKSFDNSSFKSSKTGEKSPVSRSFTKLNESFKEEEIHEEEQPGKEPSAQPIRLSRSFSKTPVPLELSNSLKESIDIDNKLGKVPKATRIINDEELLRQHRAKLGLASKNDSGEEEDVDDYHSKGW